MVASARPLRESSMRPLVTLAALLALTVACGGDTPASPTPFPFSATALPTPPVLMRGTLRASVDGQPWSAVPFVYFSTGPGTDRFTVFGGSGLGSDPSLQVSGPLSVGTYSASGATPATFVLAHFGFWSVNPLDPASSGSLTVTTASRTRVAGTFAFTGLPGGNSAGAAPRVVTNGTFDVSQ